jgi:trimeric autotransporter adhesin
MAGYGQLNQLMLSKPCIVPATITGTLSVTSGSTTALSDATAGGTWSSSNTAVGSVNTSGVVTGVAAGNCTISYTMCAGYYATAAVTVNSAATGPTYDASNTNSNIVLSAGNTVATMTTSGSSAQGLAYLTTAIGAAKVHLEVSVNITGSAAGYFEGCGITVGSRAASLGTGSAGNVSAGYAYMCDAAAGQKVHNGVETSWGVALANGDVFMMDVDNVNGFIYFGKNGTYMNSGVPTSGSSGTGAAYAFATGSSIYFAVSLGNYSSGSKCIMTLQATPAYLPSGYTNKTP